MAEWFVYTLITLDVCAAITYGYQGDFARVIYWGCAAALTSTTLYMR